MRRADRLFQIVQSLRRRRVTTARKLAEDLEVSERTIYRDIQDLTMSGVPIEGEAGVGYRLKGYDLPPLMFSHDEVEALVLGVRIVESWTDPKLARAARQVLEKVETVLPQGREHLVRETALFAPKHPWRAEVTIDFGALREAIRELRKVRFGYRDAGGQVTRRTVQPFGLAFYGPVWMLAAWCELRQDYRTFRPDRMSEMDVLEETFSRDDEPSFEMFMNRLASD